MPTEISNAIGTERQFTPQPDGVYQGHYQGLGVSQGASAQPKVLDVADSMAKLSEALQGYTVNHEKYLNAKGEIEATDMINGMSAGDIEKLNAIDAAQLEGYADSAANPYFTAYAEKLRGNFLGARVRQDYDAKYAMEPAKSAEEEMKRYSNFMNEWRDTYLKNSAPQNQLAFDRGFYENSMVNMGNLASTWNKKKNEEDVVVTMAQVESDLGDVIANSGELLSKDNHSFSDAVQTALNPVRLMGLPPQYRQKLVSDFVNQVIDTGHIPLKRLEQMLDNVVVQTSMDGTVTKMGDLVNRQSIRTINLANNIRYDNKCKEDLLKKYGDNKQYDKFLSEADALKDKDPEEYRFRMSLAPEVYSRQKAKENEEKAIARERAAYARRTLGGGSSGSGSSSSKLTNPQDFKEMLSVWQEGGTIFRGRPMSSYNVDKDGFYDELNNQVVYLVQNGAISNLDRLMRMPQASQLKEDIGKQFVYSLDAIKVGEDGHAAYDENTQHLLNFLTYNAKSTEHLFGKDVADRAHILAGLVRFTGDFQKGVDLFATWNGVPDDEKQSWKEQVKDQLVATNYVVNGVENLDVEESAQDVPVWGDANLESSMVTMGAIFAKQRGSAYSGLNDAGSCLQDNFYYYKGAVMPKDILNGVDSGDNDRSNFLWALQDEMDFKDDVRIQYSRDDQLFYFTSSSPHTINGVSTYSWSKPLSYFIEAAREHAEDVGKKVMEENNTAYTPETVNADRSASTASMETVGEAERTASNAALENAQNTTNIISDALDAVEDTASSAIKKVKGLFS